MLQFYRWWISSSYIHFNSSFSQLPAQNAPPTYSSTLLAAQYLFSCLVIAASPTTPLQLQVLPYWLTCYPSDARVGCTHWRFYICLEVHVTECVKHHLMCTAPGVCQVFYSFQQYCVQFTPGWGQKRAWVFAENTYWNSKKTHSVTWLAWKLLWEPLPVSSVIQSSLQEF